MHISVYLGDIYTKFKKAILNTFTAQCYVVASLWRGKNCLSEQRCVGSFDLYFIRIILGPVFL
jgi:hypothetical protein